MNISQSTTFRTTLQHQQLQKVYRAYLNSVAEHTEGRLVAGQKTRDGLALGQQLMNATADQWEDFRNIWQHNPERIWVWSDLHLSHKNISRHAGRPFDNIMYMNQTLQTNAQCVPENDIVLCLGDVSFDDPIYTQQWLSQCPGRKFLILGNHDIDRSYKREALLSLGFEGVAECLALPHKDHQLWLTHYPLGRNCLPKDTINVHGHTHQHSIEGPYVNVCVEHVNYTPVKMLSVLN